MLDDNRLIYENTADALIENWRETDVNDLIRSACDCSPYMKDGYIAAIMCKYWNKISKYYSMCKLVTTPEDIHSWLTESILYTIKHRPWTREDSSIYNDPKGPDKVLNRCMISRRLTFYQQLNRYNRKINTLTYSLESLNTDFQDMFTPYYLDNYTVHIDDLVISSFSKKEYIKAFIIDAIVYENIVKKEINIKHLQRHLKNLDEQFKKRFSKTYSINIQQVNDACEIINGISNNKLKKHLQYNLIWLKNRLQETL